MSHLRVYVGAYGWFAHMWVVNLQRPWCTAARSAKQDAWYISIGESWRQIEWETKQQPSDPSASPSCPRAVNSITLFSAGPRGQVTWPRVHLLHLLHLLHRCRKTPKIRLPPPPSPTHRSVPGGGRAVWCGQEDKDASVQTLSDTKEEERKRAQRNRKCALQEQTQTGEGDGLLKAAREGGRGRTRDLKDLRGGGRGRDPAKHRK